MKRSISIACICIAIFYHGLFSQNVPSSLKPSVDSLSKSGSLDSHAQTTKQVEFDGVDGPYIINDTLYRVNTDYKLIKEVEYDSDSVSVVVDNISEDQFYVSLETQHEIFRNSYAEPEKLVIISDIEGKYNAFASFLMSNNIMDENHDWIFGSGHLVLLGDFVDRGKNVTQVLWLIYKLEQQALVKNGHVHFILGNHEVLNFHGDYRYNQGKYIKVAQKISHYSDKTKAIRFLYSDKSVLGKWLATKNVIERIGDYLFAHGGINPEILDYKLTLDAINTKARFGFYHKEDGKDTIIDFLYSGKGPFWYRGLVMNRSEYNKIEDTDLEGILSYYQSKKIVIGHTPVENISTDYKGRVIRMDVSHGLKKFTGKTKGLLIDNGIEYIIDDMGNRTALD